VSYRNYQLQPVALVLTLQPGKQPLMLYWLVLLPPVGQPL
jgi:hypothetical protein